MTSEGRSDPLRAFFDRAAVGRRSYSKADPILDYEQKARSRMLMTLLAASADDVVLEVGCGSGRDLIELSRKSCKCAGVDFSAGMIEESRKELLENGYEDVELEVADATNLRFSSETFDKVYASEVLEHIPNWEKAVCEMQRVLKPGGTLVVTTPNRLSFYGFDRYVLRKRLLRKNSRHPHDAWKTFDELAQALKQNGLRIEAVEGACYIPGYTIPYRLPKFLKKIIVIIVAALEPWLKKAFPKNGYMVGLKGIKKSAEGKTSGTD